MFNATLTYLHIYSVTTCLLKSDRISGGHRPFGNINVRGLFVLELTKINDGSTLHAQLVQLGLYSSCLNILPTGAVKQYASSTKKKTIEQRPFFDPGE